MDRAKIGPTRWQQMTGQAVEAEIKDLLLLEAAQKEGMTISSDQIDQEVERSKELIGKDQFRKMLKTKSTTEDKYRDFIKEKLLINKYKAKLFKKANVDENIIKDYYEGHREQLRAPERVRIEVITVGNKKIAAQVEKRLIAGESLEKAAGEISREKSDIRKVRTRWMPYEAIPNELRLKISKSSKGAVLTHIQKKDEVLVIRIIDKRPAGIMPFEETQDQIKEILLQKRHIDILDSWYNAEKKKAVIEYLN